MGITILRLLTLEGVNIAIGSGWDKSEPDNGGTKELAPICHDSVIENQLISNKTLFVL